MAQCRDCQLPSLPVNDSRLVALLPPFADRSAGSPAEPAREADELPIRSSSSTRAFANPRRPPSSAAHRLGASATCSATTTRASPSLRKAGAFGSPLIAPRGCPPPDRGRSAPSSPACHWSRLPAVETSRVRLRSDLRAGYRRWAVAIMCARAAAGSALLAAPPPRAGPYLRSPVR